MYQILAAYSFKHHCQYLKQIQFVYKQESKTSTENLHKTSVQLILSLLPLHLENVTFVLLWHHCVKMDHMQKKQIGTLASNWLCCQKHQQVAISTVLEAKAVSIVSNVGFLLREWDHCKMASTMNTCLILLVAVHIYWMFRFTQIDNLWQCTFLCSTPHMAISTLFKSDEGKFDVAIFSLRFSNILYVNITVVLVIDCGYNDAAFVLGWMMSRVLWNILKLFHLMAPETT